VVVVRDGVNDAPFLAAARRDRDGAAQLNNVVRFHNWRYIVEMVFEGKPLFSGESPVFREIHHEFKHIAPRISVGAR
jgi:hypothetical protein